MAFTMKDFEDAMRSLITSAPKERTVRLYTGQWGYTHFTMMMRFEVMTAEQKANLKRKKASWLARPLHIVDIDGFIWRYIPGKGYEDKPMGAANCEPIKRKDTKLSRFNQWEHALRQV